MLVAIAIIASKLHPSHHIELLWKYKRKFVQYSYLSHSIYSKYCTSLATTYIIITAPSQPQQASGLHSCSNIVTITQSLAHIQGTYI